MQRLTTEFVDSEDRLRLCGESAPQQTQVLWLTQRLLQRLLPHLWHWLEQQSAVAGGVGADVRAEVVQGFAQQAAVASLAPQAPVQAAAAEQAWLVQSVDVAMLAQALRLTFKGPLPEQVANLTLPTQALRQWLAIVHGQCCLAGWVSTPTTTAGMVWPEWMQANHPAEPAPAVWH
ncbi:MAG: hypothetical protein C0445_00670 [Polaromonas sp.]|nr:hypothetical protein [Polaromonas sp.]